MRLSLRARLARNLDEFGRRDAEFAFSFPVSDAALAHDFTAQDFAVDAQFLVAHLRVSDGDAFGRAIALPQTIGAVFHPPRVGQIALRINRLGQALNALVEILPAQIRLKLSDQFVGARSEYSLESLGAEMAL